MNLKMGRRPVSYWLGGAQGAGELGSVRCGWHTWAKQLGNPGCTQGCRAEQKSCKCSGSPEESGQRNSRGVYRQPGAVDPASVAVGHQRLMVPLQCCNNAHLAGALTPLPSSCPNCVSFSDLSATPFPAIPLWRSLPSRGRNSPSLTKGRNSIKNTTTT